MNRFLKRLLIIVLLYSNIVYGQNEDVKDLFYNVTIQSGAGKHGFTKIQFQYEGLLCRTFEENESLERSVIFIPLEELDQKKWIKLFNFINEMDLMGLNYDNIHNVYYTVSIKIHIYEVYQNKYVQYQYNRYNPALDKLIILLNELVPKEYRDLFNNKRIPK